MSSRLTRAIAAVCGVLGVGMLTAHFLISAGIPNDSAGVARTTAFAHQHRDSLLISAWLQVTGAVLYVMFILAIVHFAGATASLAGRVTLLAGTVLVTLTLVDTALITAAVQAATHGHPETLRVGFDLIAGPNNDAIGLSFLTAPAILIPLGIVILQTLLMSRAYCRRALAFEAVSQILALIGLCSQIVFADVTPTILGLENLWLIAVALALLRTSPTGRITSGPGLSAESHRDPSRRWRRGCRARVG
jgi:hypothetical protein